jgi:hypothetical protein
MNGSECFFLHCAVIFLAHVVKLIGRDVERPGDMPPPRSRQPIFKVKGAKIHFDAMMCISIALSAAPANGQYREKLVFRNACSA